MGIIVSSMFSSAVDSLKFPPTAFPKGKPIQKNLDTHYVDLEALFRSLAREGFGGTVLMVFEEGTESLIVFREGTIITAYDGDGQVKRTGLKALSHSLGLAKQNRAYVDVFKTEHEILVALLPLLHGVQASGQEAKSLEEMLADFRKAEFVGAIVAGDHVPEAVGLVYAGTPMGWFDAQGVEHETGAKPPVMRSTTFRAFALENADTFAAINLALDKQIVAGKVRDLLFREFQELGFVLYARALERAAITDERTASKSQFLSLSAEFERAVETLRGPGHARRVGAELHEVIGTMIDVGF
jgi:hypothetical protein